MSLFPSRAYDDAGAYAEHYFAQVAKGTAAVDRSAVAAAGRLLAQRIHDGRRLYSCGNGGSAAIANHLVCDCLKGVRTGGVLKPKVHSLISTMELTTAIVNDLGPEEMFSYPLESLAEAGDVLIAISSSGESANIVRALETARRMDVATVALTGFDGGAAAKLADVSIHVPVHNYGVVEDVHQSIMHVLAQYLRHSHLDPTMRLGETRF
ncbi:D-sedoheptulose-7-phosphate isomerase [Brevundimonas sp. VNH65]|uniref:D-sedoheptulose-7-phosphate isomerase n=1 Tax=Brevundimonas sp. VNH65 TaxID=3400917 RepID=UPI003BFB5C81